MSMILLFTSQHKGGIGENMLIQVVNTTGSEETMKSESYLNVKGNRI